MVPPKPRVEVNAEQFKTQVRMFIWMYVRKPGWEYPSGVEEKISQAFMDRKLSPRLTAKNICDSHWPDEMIVFDALPVCKRCLGDGLSTDSEGKKSKTVACKPCNGSGKVVPGREAI